MTEESSIRLEREVDINTAADAKLSGIRGRLKLLAATPPQVLILEGGDQQQRESLALWWAATLNCQAEKHPCLDCPDCRHIIAGTHPDLYFLEAGHMSILIEHVREVLSVIGEAPRGEGHRCIILADAHMLNPSSANALLKAMEEPRPGTVFVMLTPQREKILPTLVSRAMTFTIPWPRSLHQPDADLLPLLQGFGQFACEGKGWLGRAQIKGAAGKELAERLILQIQRDLLAALQREHLSDALNDYFSSRRDPRLLRNLDIILEQCRQSLALGVNPALVLDYLAIKMHLQAKTELHPYR